MNNSEIKLNNIYYKDLGFISYYIKLGLNHFLLGNDLLILDKTPENIHKLEAKLPHPITTEFHSTYPL
jgi:hypothetical protein